MELYRNRYRIYSTRLPNWDYSANALYFLTIVTQGRVCNLGEIIESNNEHHIELSEFGKIVEQEWVKSFEIRKELILHESIIMPNHIHAIVEIYNKNQVNKGLVGCSAEMHGRASLQNPNPNGIVNQTSTISNASPITLIKRNPPIRLPQSISSFIAGFKSAVNTKINDYIDEHRLEVPKYNRKNHFFLPNYHDHIIRNDLEYYRIKNYIINNPKNWNKDKLLSNR